MNIKTMENKVKVWIARDKDRELFVYSDIPIRCKNHWGYPTCFYIDKSMFPSVKWEDDKPTEAYITFAEPQEQRKQEPQPKTKQEIDWEQRRYESAKEMMLEIYRHKIAVSEPRQAIAIKDIVDVAVLFADMLIQKLREKSE